MKKKKYQKRPLEVYAEQFFEASQYWPEGVILNVNGIPGVRTPRGFFSVSDGDWVITGIDGTKYPCKDAIFVRTYEEIPE